jgi:hypothetical protein
LDLSTAAHALFGRPRLRLRCVVVVHYVPFETPFQVVAVFHDLELRPKHLIVGLLLIIQFLEVREHHAKLGLHVCSQLVRFPL